MSERIVMQLGAATQPLTLGAGLGPLCDSHGKRWGGPPMELHELGTTAPGARVGPPPSERGVLLVLAGRVDVEVREGRRINRYCHRPGTLVLLSGDAPREVLRLEGSAQGLAIALTEGWRPEHGTLPDRDWHDRTMTLEPDAAALALGFAIRSELESGAPNGPLFSEALTLSLLRLTDQRAATDVPARALTRAECTRIHEHVECHLAGPISIDGLADLVGLRRRQFSMRFRASFGMSPYNFVLQRRVARGAVLLANGQPISEVAAAVGFCSQSHFTSAYRRQLGMTPSAGQRRSVVLGPGARVAYRTRVTAMGNSDQS